MWVRGKMKKTGGCRRGFRKVRGRTGCWKKQRTGLGRKKY